MTSSEDSQLIHALHVRDCNWLHTHLHAPLSVRLQHLARLYHLPCHLIDDVYQEVLLKLYRFGPRYHSSFPNPRAWIARLTTRTLIDMARKESRHQQRRLPATAASDEGACPTDSLRDHRVVVRWERFDALLEAALARVPRADHRLVLRDRLAGLSQKEVSTKHNLPPNTVGVLFNRFKKRVAALLEAEIVGHLG
jgi:RNA polymerase sigma factor (sigma-70 family)